MSHADKKPTRAKRAAPRSHALRSWDMVGLRFVRSGKTELRSQDGRFVLRKTYASEGARPARWSLWENGHFRDAATWTEVRTTAREILEREAQSNIPNLPTSKP